MIARAYILIGTHLGAALLAGYTGWHLRDGDYQRHLAKDASQQASQAKAQVVQERGREAVSQQAREEVSVKAAKVETVTRILYKKVPIYVPPQAPAVRAIDDAGGLNLGFVWLHNSAASGVQDALTPGLDPGTPAGIGMPALADTLVYNYGVCHKLRVEAQGWRDWYAKHVAGSTGS